MDEAEVPGGQILSPVHSQTSLPTTNKSLSCLTASDASESRCAHHKVKSLSRVRLPATRAL